MAASTLDDRLTWHEVGENSGKSADSKASTQPPTQPPLKCPECGSPRIWKDGVRYARGEAGGEIAVQRYICRDCGRRFSEDTGLGSYLRPNRHVFNLSSGLSTCQVSVTETEGTKNLSHQRTRQKQAKRGATRDVKGEIISFTWHLNKNGYEESTIKLYTKLMNRLHRLGADIFDPENVKEVVAAQKWGNAVRHNVIGAYTAFLKMYGETWEKPRCEIVRKLPFIPTEAEIDALIAGCGKKTSTFLQLLKETAVRSCEANNMLWINIDFERRTITLNNPAKHSNPRIFNASNKLIDMLSALPKKSEKVFGDSNVNSKRSALCRTRRTVARKLQNPRLLRISFHTLRHWKATMLYHQTKDLLYVKNFLGHKRIETTELYIQLENTLFKNEAEDFTVRVATGQDDIKKLLEVGFEYVCEKDGELYFRKRK